MISPRQKEVFDFISDYVEAQGYAPSLQEIADHFGLASVSTAHHHVTQLQKKGYLTREGHVARGIELNRDRARPATPFGAGAAEGGVVWVPLVGRIAAGAPIEAVETADTVAIPSTMLGRGETFVLQVKGDSMRDEQIRDGDFVIVEKRATAENGETVVALLHGSEATLKKFYREGEHVRLQPANEEFEPLLVHAAKVAIQGIVIGVLRKYRQAGSKLAKNQTPSA